PRDLRRLNSSLDISSGSSRGKPRLRCLSKFLQRRARWREERCAGVRGREVEQPVVSARRVADIHSLQHLLDHPKISRIADKIRPELPLPIRPQQAADVVGSIGGTRSCYLSKRGGRHAASFSLYSGLGRFILRCVYPEIAAQDRPPAFG